MAGAPSGLAINNVISYGHPPAGGRAEGALVLSASSHAALAISFLKPPQFFLRERFRAADGYRGEQALRV